MDKALLERISQISEEEQKILDGGNVDPSIYSTTTRFTVNTSKMLRRKQLIDIRPHCRFAHFPRHNHNYIEIVYMCAGHATHIVNGAATITLNPGELLFLNLNAEHEILRCGYNDVMINFIVLPRFFKRAFTMSESDNMIFDFIFSHDDDGYLYFKASDILPVQNLVENMIWSIVNKRKYIRDINQYTMGLLILHLLNNTKRINIDDPYQYERNIIIEVLTYIENHYRDASFAEFAEKKGIPLYSLSKLVKKHTGKNYKELLQQRRLDKAAQFLTQSKKAVEEIASEVGYENSSYFHKLFRDKYGVTPLKFRKLGIEPLLDGEGEFTDNMPKWQW